MKKLHFLKTMLLLCALIVGSGTMLADTVTYTVKSKTAVSTSGTAPEGSSASYSSTYSTMCQLTAGNSMTLTLSGYEGYKITGITLSMKSNSAKGAGSLSVTAGETDIAGISDAAFNTASWYGAWSTSYVDVNVSMDEDSYEIQDGENVVITIAATVNSLYCQSFTLTYEEATGGGGSELENCDLALTDAPIALNFDLYNKASAQVINYTTSSTGAVTIADSEYATFDIDEENKTITVTPTAVTPSAQTITVNQEADETYKAGTATFTLTITDSTPLPTYTVTFSDGGSVTQETPGASVTLPSRDEKAGYAFAGWSATEVAEETTTAPTIIPAGSYTPTENITLYPVYSKTEGGGGEQKKTTSVNIGTYASANSWTSGTKYTSVTLDGNITASVSNGGSNTGKFYDSNNSWRFYANESGKLTISTGSGELTSITITYTGNTLTYGGNNVTSGTSVNVSGTSATFSVSGSSSNTQITAISVNYTIAGAGTTYYWSNPVAAAVEKPTITVTSPFTFSTEVSMSCETEGATIYYTLDGTDPTAESTEYTAHFDINATTTIKAIAIKDANESGITTVTATKNKAKTTVTITTVGITNTDVYTATEAGSLGAIVKYNDDPVEGAVVTWEGNNDAVATIDAETGVVTLVAVGSVTFTATYAGNDDYEGDTEDYVMTVTTSDPNVPGTKNNPYTVAQARAAIDAGSGVTNVYATGIVSQTGTLNSGSISYYISDDGTTKDQLQAYRGKGIGNADFSSKDDIQLGDVVVIYGNLTKYNTTYEFASGNYLISLVRKVATPTFDPAAGEVIAGSTVSISTTTEDATIYYTTNGDEPTTESTQYTEPITINADMTIKAIAVKDGLTNSDVASASYTIIVTPTITVAQTAIEAEAAGKDGSIEVTYNNFNMEETSVDVIYCDAEGNDTSYDWFIASINNESNNVDYVISENTSTEARTGYIRVYAIYDDEYFSDIITITQAGVVIDYAELPFEYDGDATGDLPAGLTQVGLGTKTYASSPKIGFDTTGDELVLKINEIPGELSFDIKGNSFSGGKFKVQTSANGVDYTDIATYTELGNSTKTVKRNLAGDVRYVKWIYTEKVSGNVALGNIILTNTNTITLAEACTDGAKHYATYSLGKAFVVPENLTVSTVGLDGEGKLVITPYSTGDVVKANTGVLVSADSYGNKTVVVSAETGTENDGNLLKPSGDAGITAGDMNMDNTSFYRLTMHNGTEIGFWWGAENGVAFNLAANKAYLAVPDAEALGREGFAFNDEGGATGIANVRGKMENVRGDFYDLSGRKVAEPQKGLYIVNGKKVVIK